MDGFLMNGTRDISENFKLPQIFLIVASTGLMPIALSYGLFPQKSMPWLFDLDASALNFIHILRAVMGLYLALIVFWLCGAFNRVLTLPALYSLMVFMLGLAGGRESTQFIHRRCGALATHSLPNTRSIIWRRGAMDY